MSITYKDAAGIAAMRVACRLASEVLDYLTPFIKPGITTNEIDRLAAEYMVKQGTTSATVVSTSTTAQVTSRTVIAAMIPRGWFRRSAGIGRLKVRRRRTEQEG